MNTLAARIDQNWLLVCGAYGFISNPVFEVNDAKVAAEDVFEVPSQSYTLIRLNLQNEALAATVSKRNMVVNLFVALNGKANDVPAKITDTKVACYSAGIGGVFVKSRGAMESIGTINKNEKNFLIYSFATPLRCKGFLVGVTQKHGQTSFLLGQTLGGNTHSFEAFTQPLFNAVKAVIQKEDPSAWDRIAKHAITDQKAL